MIGRALSVAVLIGALVGCGNSASTANQQTTTVGTTVGGGQVPQPLRFSAPLVGGGEFVGADHAGRPTVFWFWAPT